MAPTSTLQSSFFISEGYPKVFDGVKCLMGSRAQARVSVTRTDTDGPEEHGKISLGRYGTPVSASKLQCVFYRLILDLTVVDLT